MSGSDHLFSKAYLRRGKDNSTKLEHGDSFFFNLSIHNAINKKERTAREFDVTKEETLNGILFSRAISLSSKLEL